MVRGRRQVLRRGQLAGPLALLTLTLIAAACGSDEGASLLPESAEGTDANGAPLVGEAEPIPVPGEPPRLVQQVTLTPAFGGRAFSRPVELAPYPSGRLLVAEQDGLLLLSGAGDGEESLLFDMEDRVSRRGNEEGLLSFALAPSFDETGHLFVYYSVAGARASQLSRLTVVDALGPEPNVDPASELEILHLEQPFRNHNGGAVRFGPDGLLYLGLGDGGGSGDPQGNGQDRATLFGSIIRIDVSGATADEPYRIPPDNPFLTTAGARSELWAYGLRNPWRMAFDPATGALWVADVGQNRIEEVDRVVVGGNYGWNRLEGDQCFRPSEDCDRSGTVAPVATYTHEEGCSVTGGVVYRGTAVPALTGFYLYGDFCSGRIWALATAGEAVPVLVAETEAAVASFGVDADGEVYILRFSGPILRVVAAE